jgi:hypothetical protein
MIYIQDDHSFNRLTFFLFQAITLHENVLVEDHMGFLHISKLLEFETRTMKTHTNSIHESVFLLSLLYLSKSQCQPSYVGVINCV